jgi:hypothetical protein
MEGATSVPLERETVAIIAELAAVPTGAAGGRVLAFSRARRKAAACGVFCTGFDKPDIGGPRRLVSRDADEKSP